jgi:phospholipase/lecithinase/hemolysin
MTLNFFQPNTTMPSVQLSFGSETSAYQNLAQQSLSQISDLYVFGDALSDTGNLARATAGAFPRQPFVNDKFSNGSIWVDYLAAELGLAYNPSNNFAFAGAISGTNNVGDPRVVGDPVERLGLTGLLAQVSGYLRTTSNADPNGLYTIWIGADDYLAGETDPTIPVSNIVAAVLTLVDAGARTILVPNLPDLSQLPDVLNNPFAGDLQGLVAAHNANLAEALQQLEHTLSLEVNLIPLDVATLFEETVADSERSGLTNTTDAYFTENADASITFAEGDANEFAFFGRYHPSTVTHRLVAEVALSALTDTGAGATEAFGTVAEDRIQGTLQPERILGLAGDDQISGRGKADTLLGGEGNDLLSGNAGNDLLLGEVGDDTLRGGFGNDRLNGGPGSNRLVGNQGQDRFILNRNGFSLIEDFQDGQDRLELAGALKFSELSMSQQGSATVILLSGNQIASLPGISADTITVADFMNSTLTGY